MPGKLAHEECVADCESGLDVCGDAGGEVGASVGVEGNSERTAKHAAVKGGDPFGAVLGPEHDAVAGADVLLGEKCRESAGESGDVAIGGNAAAVALVADHGDFAVVAAEIFNEGGQVIAHGCSARSW